MRTLHTPDSELWNCEFRFIILVLISALSLADFGVEMAVESGTTCAVSIGFLVCVFRIADALRCRHQDGMCRVASDLEDAPAS